MMKVWLVICLGLVVVGCQTTNPAFLRIKETANPQTLIVYYEQGEKESALRVAKELGADVVYEYNTLNSIAINTKYPNTALEKLRITKGILSAQVSQIYELH